MTQKRMEGVTCLSGLIPMHMVWEPDQAQLYVVCHLRSIRYQCDGVAVVCGGEKPNVNS